ncbi:glycosyl transferase [Agrobacterium sp. a22-2]|uniref:O-linked N-acetylglucosamine transferase, SPINDLY family protein n=1 Tax=Agrobacterium sp. a22-2 TaxID=2283840 RepID=UPI00144699E1|nr:glycosyl transferase [Agrobacterium sp. a22-2]NKN38103.1 glycosyl transferase [Agrobacterium sp. a22-2]
MSVSALVMEKQKSGDFLGVVKLLKPLADEGDGLDAAALVRLAQSCYRIGHVQDAASYYHRAAGMAGAPRQQLLELAFTLFRQAKHKELAFGAARDVLEYNPGHEGAARYFRHHVHYRLDMEELERSDGEALEKIRAGDAFQIRTELLLDHIAWCGDEALNALIQTQNGKTFSPEARARRRSRPHPFADKIRVGYLSNDWSDEHATLKLLQRVLELHDENTFEITLFCYTEDNLVATDRVFRERFGDKIVRIGHLPTEDAAQLIKARSIDILVDLKGHTNKSWIDLVNAGPAPVQVAYLGYPGSGVGIDCDYITCDRIVCPETRAPFFHEKFCWLPDSYQPNDDSNRALPPAPSRSQLGLPDEATVLVSANNVRKISPETFRLWMAVLARAPRTVLWMVCNDPVARGNFSRAVANAGIAPERIIYANSAGYPAHIARLRAADIGLDTFPCNGHTTTSDKLWAGLPVVTKKGSNFSSRVSESLLRAMQLPELVAENGDRYVDLCVELASDAERLRALKTRIESGRTTAALFDSRRYTRNLERAFQMIHERAKNGLEPAHLAVE